LSDDFLRGSQFGDGVPDRICGSRCDFGGNNSDEIGLCRGGDGEGVVDGRCVIELGGC